MKRFDFVEKLNASRRFKGFPHWHLLAIMGLGFVLFLSSTITVPNASTNPSQDNSPRSRFEQTITLPLASLLTLTDSNDTGNKDAEIADTATADTATAAADSATAQD